MKQSRIIITGGIGTGKSTVSNHLMEKGYKVIDFDKISKSIYIKGSDVYTKLVEAFGEDIRNKKGDIDRIKLGSIVFADKEKLEKLNEITHKYIFESAKEQILELRDEVVIFLDIPLYFEISNKMEEYNIDIDKVLLVYANEELQIKRIIDRDREFREKAENKVRLQIPIEDKKNMSDIVIHNEGSKELLFEEIEKALKNLLMRGN